MLRWLFGGPSDIEMQLAVAKARASIPLNCEECTKMVYLITGMLDDGCEDFRRVLRNCAADACHEPRCLDGMFIRRLNRGIE